MSGERVPGSSLPVNVPAATAGWRLSSTPNLSLDCTKIAADLSADAGPCYSGVMVWPRFVLVVALATGGLLARPGLADDDAMPGSSEGDRLPVLIDALRSSANFKVRATAAVALGRIGDARALPSLVEVLRADEHYAVRVAAAAALGRLTTMEAIQPLLGALHDQDQFVREEAEAALLRFHTPATVFAFRDGLQSDDAVVRLAAVQAYGDVLKDLPGVGALVVQALGDDDEAVRKAAETAISSLPHERAAPLLVGALTSSGSAVRLAAAQMLAARADRNAVDPLIGIVTSSEEGEDLRRTAAESLKAHAAFIHVPSRIAAASDTSAANRDARLQAIRVLASLNDASAPALVEKALADTDAAVRISAARAAADLRSDVGRKLLASARAKETDARLQRQLDLIIKSSR